MYVCMYMYLKLLLQFANNTLLVLNCYFNISQFESERREMIVTNTQSTPSNMTMDGDCILQCSLYPLHPSLLLPPLSLTHLASVSSSLSIPKVKNTQYNCHHATKSNFYINFSFLPFLLTCLVKLLYIKHNI